MNIINDINIDDSDEDEVLFINNYLIPRRNPVYRHRFDNFNLWNDEEFFIRFRLSKNTCNLVLLQIEDVIRHSTDWNHALTPTQMLLLTLRYYATGSMLIVVGDFTGCHKSTASRVIKKVSRAIASLHRHYIKMPSIPEQQEVRQQFYNIARFPRVIGAIDCTHVKIQSPGGENAELFRNRKSFFSINVQTISDARLRIMDIVARWPGSAHDSNIFRNSFIRARFENNEMGNNLLLGDSGYQNTKYMITPLANPGTRAEMLFNESQIRTRNVVERSYGVWKRRFPILAVGVKVKMNTIQSIIVATAILNNIAIDANERVPHLNEELEEAVNFVNNVPNVIINHNRRNIQNNRIRNNLINAYFANLL